MDFGKDFPIADYYREHILDAETVSRSSGWWTAVLLIEDPVSKNPFIALYQWKSTGSGWKKHKSFNIKQNKKIKSIIEVMKRFSEKVK